jgi:ribonuclease HI
VVVKERTLQGGEALTTNNRMELLAAISALEALTARPRSPSSPTAPM